MPISERLQSVEQHNVEIARQPAVLKGVVKEQHLIGILSERFSRCGNSVSILQMRDSRQPGRQFQRLIVRPAAATVTPANERDRFSLALKKFCQPANQRRFASAANGQIPHANDRRIHSHRCSVSTVKPPVPLPHNTAVNWLKRRQKHPRAPPQQPLAAAGNDVAKMSGE